MANDGAISFSVRLDAGKAERELNNIKKKILALQAELATQQQTRDGLAENLRQVAAAAVEAHEKLIAMREAGAAPSAILNQKNIVAGLDKEYAQAQAALDKQDQSITKLQGSLQTLANRYGLVQKAAMSSGKAGEEAAQKSSGATNELNSRLSKTANRIFNLAKRILVFSLMTRAFRAFRSYAEKALKTSAEFTEATARLKGALMTAFQPIFTAVLPALITFINILTAGITAIANFVSALFGIDAGQNKENAKSLYEESEALDKVGGSAGKAAKQLANFDEINKLGDSGGGGASGALSKVEPLFNFDGALDATGLREAMEGPLGDILLIGGELLVVVGLIAAFTGNVALGVGLIAAGAVALGAAKELNPEALKKALNGPIGTILTIGGFLLLAVGFIVAFTGNIPLGAGLIAAGAFMLGSTKAMNPEGLKKALNGPIGKIIVVTSELLIVAGFIVAFTGNIFLGIGLIAAGAAILGTMKYLAPDGLSEALNGPIGSVLLVTSQLLLVVGFIVAFTGNLFLGVGLIAAGAVVLGTVGYLSPEGLSEALNGPIGEVLVIGGILLLVAGFICVFTGGIPLGIGLIAAGAVVLGTEAALNPESFKEILHEAIRKTINIADSVFKIVTGFIKAFTGDIPGGLALIAEGAAMFDATVDTENNPVLDFFSEKWSEIVGWYQREIAPVFTAQYWTDKFYSIVDGMRAAMNGVLGAVETALNWIVDKMNGFKLDIGTPFGTKTIGFSLPRVSLPRLAAGAVIPPNREFLAVLGDQSSGTNIEAPLETIVTAFRQALAESGGGNRTLVLQVGEQEFASIVFNAFSAESGRVGISMVN